MHAGLEWECRLVRRHRSLNAETSSFPFDKGKKNRRKKGRRMWKPGACERYVGGGVVPRSGEQPCGVKLPIITKIHVLVVTVNHVLAYIEPSL
jgi:hypothetical protein